MNSKEVEHLKVLWEQAKNKTILANEAWAAVQHQRKALIDMHVAQGMSRLKASAEVDAVLNSDQSEFEAALANLRQIEADLKDAQAREGAAPPANE